MNEWVIYRFQLAHLRVFQSYFILFQFDNHELNPPISFCTCCTWRRSCWSCFHGIGKTFTAFTRYRFHLPWLWILIIRSRLRRLCLARILTSKKTFRSNNSTSNANRLPLYSEVIQLFRSTNLPWKKLPGKDRGWKYPKLSGRIFYLTISLKS